MKHLGKFGEVIRIFGEEVIDVMLDFYEGDLSRDDAIKKLEDMKGRDVATDDAKERIDHFIGIVIEKGQGNESI
jgi:hypothetical protein